MTDTISLRCRCGTLQGQLARPDGERGRCYCRDCQSAAHHLGGPVALDQWGGSDLLITTPGFLTLTDGTDQLHALRLSPKGPLRWYAACCNTPVANTLPTAAVPFVALNLAFVAEQHRGQLGPARFGVYIEDAHGQPDLPAGHRGRSLGVLAAVGARILRGRLRGHHRRTPFFSADGRPVSAAQLLSREQRREALARAGF